MARVLIATNNAHKLHELGQILAESHCALVSPADLGIALDVQETGVTYAENAELKARSLAETSGLVTLADDSGLEVAALAGEPGIRSARYAGEGAPNAQRIAKLLGNLAGVAWADRGARFVCVIAVCEPGGPTHLLRGACAGFIAFEPKGSQGFGYDPVFYMPDYGCTMAELDDAQKNLVSHRGRAGKQAAAFLARLFAGGSPD
jgi:XTP/dITP diphosphohydrolase